MPLNNCAVLSALSEVAGVNLQSFALVHSDVERDLNATYYLCFGRQHLVLINQHLEHTPDAVSKWQLAYAHVDLIVVATREQDLFAVYTDTAAVERDMRAVQKDRDVSASSSSFSTFPPTVYFRCSDRERVLLDFKVMLKTDHLFRDWTEPFPIMITTDESMTSQLSMPKAETDARRRHGIAGVLEDERQSDEHVFEFHGYQFLAPDTLVIVPDDIDPDSVLPKVVLASSDMLVQIEMIGLTPSVAGDGVTAVSRAVEVRMQEIGSGAEDYHVLSCATPHKRSMEAAHDSAKWTCCQALVRTHGALDSSETHELLAQRDVCTIIARRELFPPTMDVRQDIAITVIGEWGNSAVESVAQRLCDSLSPTSTTILTDRLVDQAKADALVLTEDEYGWYKEYLGIEPQGARYARGFCRAVLRWLGRQQPPSNATTSNGEYDGENDRLDPFEYAMMLERDPPAPLINKRAGAMWRERVWRYLAHCVDGGMFPGVLDIEAMVAHYEVDERNRFKFTQLLDTLLYLREEGGQFEQRRVVEKFANVRLMTSCTFNRAVMERLLETNYLGKEVRANFTHYWAEYPKILVQIFKSTCRQQQRNNKSNGGFQIATDVQRAICLQIVLFTKRDVFAQAEIESLETAPPGSGNDNVGLMESVVPLLLQFLPSTDDNLCHYIVIALMSLSQNNHHVKAMVMSEAARPLVRLLGSKHSSLVRNICALLNNCTKTDQQCRQRLARSGGILALANLICRSVVAPHYTTVSVIVQATLVLGNLASDTELKRVVTGALGSVSHLSERFNRVMKVPKVVLELVGVLEDCDGEIDYISQTDVDKDWKEALQTAVVFTLKMLAYRDDVNKRVVGRLATAALVQVLQNADVNQDVLIGMCLRCICILSFDVDNCAILQLSAVSRALERHRARHENIIKQIYLRLRSGDSHS